MRNDLRYMRQLLSAVLVSVFMNALVFGGLLHLSREATARDEEQHIAVTLQMPPAPAQVMPPISQHEPVQPPENARPHVAQRFSMQNDVPKAEPLPSTPDEIMPAAVREAPPIPDPPETTTDGPGDPSPPPSMKDEPPLPRKSPGIENAPNTAATPITGETPYQSMPVIEQPAPRRIEPAMHEASMDDTSTTADDQGRNASNAGNGAALDDAPGRHHEKTPAVPGRTPRKGTGAAEPAGAGSPVSETAANIRPAEGSGQGVGQAWLPKERDDAGTTGSPSGQQSSGGHDHPSRGESTAGGTGDGVHRRAGVVSSSQPPYPRDVRDEGIEGVVVLQVSLDARARVTAVNVVKSAGDRRLDRAAERAVKRWTFEAALEDGQPVASTLRVRVQFKLE